MAIDPPADPAKGGASLPVTETETSVTPTIIDYATPRPALPVYRPKQKEQLMYLIGVALGSSGYLLATLNPIAILAISIGAYAAGFVAIERVFKFERQRRGRDRRTKNVIGTERRRAGSLSINWVYAGLIGEIFACSASDGFMFKLFAKSTDHPFDGSGPARIGIALLVPLFVAIFFVPIRR